MRTLVYFASGQPKETYEDLPFDIIYLIDNCFEDKVFKTGKVVCVGMDCLKSIGYLKSQNVKIDHFVSLNEGMFEGGGYYALNSDMFLGYAMPLFHDEYYHIMNKKYYCHQYHVTMDLPYNKTEIQENDENYLDPFIFSRDNYHKGNAKVFKMVKCREEYSLKLNSTLNTLIVHDSIWNDYDELDLMALSYADQGQDDFFKNLPKVVNIKEISFSQLLDLCVRHRIIRIGLTPWMNRDYHSVIDLLSNYRGNYPKEIRFYHLNRKDYMQLRKFS